MYSCFSVRIELYLPFPVPKQSMWEAVKQTLVIWRENPLVLPVSDTCSHQAQKCHFPWRAYARKWQSEFLNPLSKPCNVTWLHYSYDLIHQSYFMNQHYQCFCNSSQFYASVQFISSFSCHFPFHPIHWPHELTIEEWCTWIEITILCLSSCPLIHNDQVIITDLQFLFCLIKVLSCINP